MIDGGECNQNTTEIQPVGFFCRQQTAAVGLFAKQSSEVLAEVGMIRQYFQLILYIQVRLVCLLIIVSPALLFAGWSKPGNVLVVLFSRCIVGNIGEK
jgi:hypothetical protein